MSPLGDYPLGSPHVSDGFLRRFEAHLNAACECLSDECGSCRTGEPLLTELREQQEVPIVIDRRTLADAILAVAITDVDWHAGQIVKGDDESALALAGLIGDEYDRLAGPQISDLTLFLNALANTAKLDDETRAAFLRKMGR